MSSCGTSPTAPYGDLPGPPAWSTRATEPEAASVRPASDGQQGALARATRADDGDELAGGQVQADAVEDAVAAAEDDKVLRDQPRPVEGKGVAREWPPEQRWGR